MGNPQLRSYRCGFGCGGWLSGVGWGIGCLREGGGAIANMSIGLEMGLILPAP